MLDLDLPLGVPAELPILNAGHADPRTATEAATLLLAHGKHVHLVADGQARCLIDTCPPAIGDAKAPTS